MLYQTVAHALRTRFGAPPEVGIVLGSGLGALATRLEDSVGWAELGLPAAGVSGHGGRVHVGTLGGRRVAIFAGRLHLYEGHTAELAATPVRALAAWGAKAMILTSAVGGLHAEHGPGTITVVRDHINLQGQNPLRGPNIAQLGERFPDLSSLYTPRLRALVRQLQPKLPEAVYAAMPGPSYETPAEIQMLRAIGADVVGMSVVCEAIAAGHAGMELLTLAVIANPAAGLHTGTLTHHEVTEAMTAASARVEKLIVDVLEAL